MVQRLSVGIPTYNRREQLRNQLQSLFRQDLSKVFEIIIVDNHSDYDIQSVINEFDSTKIRLIINPFNIKMATNMMSPFLYCQTEWLWLLADDDETLENSIEHILTETENSEPGTGMIKFSIGRHGSIQKDKTVKNLDEYIDYYYNETIIRRGDLVFISTNVYNINRLRDYLGYGFEFSYTYIGFLIPVIIGLNDKKLSVTFSSKPIVKYIAPREGWSLGTVGKGLSTLSHLPLNLSKEYKKKFLDCTMSIEYIHLIRAYLNSDKINYHQDFRIIYNNIYRYYLPFKSKIIVTPFLFLMPIKLFKTITVNILRLLRG